MSIASSNSKSLSERHAIQRHQTGCFPYAYQASPPTCRSHFLIEGFHTERTPTYVRDKWRPLYPKLTKNKVKGLYNFCRGSGMCSGTTTWTRTESVSRSVGDSDNQERAPRKARDAYLSRFSMTVCSSRKSKPGANLLALAACIFLFCCKVSTRKSKEANPVLSLSPTGAIWDGPLYWRRQPLPNSWTEKARRLITALVHAMALTVRAPTSCYQPNHHLSRCPSSWSLKQNYGWSSQETPYVPMCELDRAEVGRFH